MKRCLETAELLYPKLLYPQLSPVVIPEWREMDFGCFEYKNYQELAGDARYQAWIDSGGTLPFPNGESMEGFKKRCRRGFAQIVREAAGMETGAGEKMPVRIAVVAHGGTIMSILERYGFPQRPYFDYQVKNGRGYLLTPVEGTELWNCQYLP